MRMMGLRHDPHTKKVYAALVMSDSGIMDGETAFEVECPKRLLKASSQEQDAWVAAYQKREMWTGQVR